MSWFDIIKVDLEDKLWSVSHVEEYLDEKFGYGKSENWGPQAKVAYGRRGERKWRWEGRDIKVEILKPVSQRPGRISVFVKEGDTFTTMPQEVIKPLNLKDITSMESMQ